MGLGFLSGGGEEYTPQMQDISGGYYFPTWPLIDQFTSGGFSQLVIGATNTRHAMIFRVPETGTVTKIHVSLSAVGTPGTADFRIETVSGGIPSGTLAGTDSNTGLINVEAGDANTVKACTLVTPLAVTRGTLLAVLIVRGTVGCEVNRIIGTQFSVGFPFTTDMASGTYQNRGNQPCMTIEYSGTTYYPIKAVWPIKALAITAASTATTPDEIGMKFRLPAKMRCRGVMGLIDAEGDYDLVLYNSAGDVLVSVSCPAAAHQQSVNDAFSVLHDFASPVVIDAESDYTIAFKPTTVTASSVVVLTMQTAAMMACLDGGADFIYRSRSDAGAWTDDNTKRPLLALLFDGATA